MANSVVVCGDCRASFAQPTKALNLLSPKLSQLCGIHATENVSAHNYDPVALEIIERVRAAGGKVLDCGAGLRSYHDEAVINLEIVDYPSTDILAVGQSLPLQDESFDAFLSLSVLEHVSDPFRCARELMRVLKVGGRAYCVVPFLQPEHGYPNHFYNMTRQGIAHLFEGSMIVDRHFVPSSGLPIWTLQWFLSEYLRHLEEPFQGRFRSMTVGEFLDRPVIEFLNENIVTGLDDTGRWILASSTALIMHKQKFD